MLPVFRALAAVMLCLALTACETPEERAARESQFNGKPLAQVSAAIGTPDLQNSKTAIWKYSERQVYFEPIYIYDEHGFARIVGHRRIMDHDYCTYIASLSGGRVVASDYQGNNCLRYAPRLPRS